MLLATAPRSVSTSRAGYIAVPVPLPMPFPLPVTVSVSVCLPAASGNWATYKSGRGYCPVTL
ncbi:hypothetical protein D7M11_19730 [Paenibacillus ginsengarvi]|uniref:Uncharacterized protein n=1 Tax=Paenibacillus ginsengarvi TaxID=400777 RepID=A0A3B0C3N3_9BACL|nr:hypothetical protein D7M11_19730 [Paenibacillus ginsengarvi]